jgi:excisionase family DNA binding protein
VGGPVTPDRPAAVGPPERVTLKPEEAADVLGVSARTLRDWTTAGLVPSIKLGGVRLYSIDALRRWASEASEYEEGSRGKASAVGNGVGLPKDWGRAVGGRRQRTPTPLRQDRT